MILSKKHSHARDSRIRFYEDTHTYFVEDRKIGISVTGLIHDVFPKFDAEGMAKKIAGGQCSSASRIKYAGMTEEDIKRRWEVDGAAASALGTKLHADIESYFNSLAVDNDSPEWRQFTAFVENESHAFEPYRTEWVVFDEDLDLAGSIDLVAIDKQNSNDKQKYVIYDWKRSKEIKESNAYECGFEGLPNCNLWHYSLQLNMYRYILQQRYGMEVSGMNLVIMHPNQETYRLIKVDVMDDITNKLVEHRRAQVKNVTPHSAVFRS